MSGKVARSSSWTRMFSNALRRSGARRPLIFAGLFAVLLLASVIAGFAAATSAVTRSNHALGTLRGDQFRDIVYAWRGIRMRPATSTVATQSAVGMVVESIVAGSPAANLRRGDIIAALDGMSVDTARGLALAIADRPPGPTVRLKVWRGDRRQMVAMSLGAPARRALAMQRAERRPAG